VILPISGSRHLILQRIDRYEILERITAGGQGTVYRARDTVLERIWGGSPAGYRGRDEGCSRPKVDRLDG